jgi:hypothetical protein
MRNMVEVIAPPSASDVIQKTVAKPGISRHITKRVILVIASLTRKKRIDFIQVPDLVNHTRKVLSENGHGLDHATSYVIVFQHCDHLHLRCLWPSLPLVVCVLLPPLILPWRWRREEACASSKVGMTKEGSSSP